MNPSEKPTISITDMTLAAFLISRGLEHEMQREEGSDKGHPIGAWVFEKDDRSKELVSLYMEGEAQVEPKSFHRVLSSTRSGMFKFLGINSD